MSMAKRSVEPVLKREIPIGKNGGGEGGRGKKY